LSGKFGNSDLASHRLDLINGQAKTDRIATAEWFHDLYGVTVGEEHRRCRSSI